MSVLIKGIKIPENCFDCKFRTFSVFGTHCAVTNKQVFDDKYENERHENCPLIEVPTSHGDLIDRNALLEHSQCLGMFDKYGEGTVADVVDAVLDQDIENAPTIIEAEE